MRMKPPWPYSGTAMLIGVVAPEIGTSVTAGENPSNDCDAMLRKSWPPLPVASTNCGVRRMLLACRSSVGLIVRCPVESGGFVFAVDAAGELPPPLQALRSAAAPRALDDASNLE